MNLASIVFVYGYFCVVYAQGKYDVALGYRLDMSGSQWISFSSQNLSFSIRVTVLYSAVGIDTKCESKRRY